MTTLWSAARVGCGIITAGLMGMLALSCTPTGSNNLTAAERGAVDASSHSGFAFAEAAGAASTVAAGQAPTAKSSPGTVNVAGCPVLTLSPTDTPNVFNVTLDFDGGCPLPNQTAPSCSGLTTGQINPTAQHLNLALLGLTCGGAPALNGTVDVDYTRTDPITTLTGNWDLAFTQGGNDTRITGPGTITFDTSAQVVTVNTFTGTLTRNADTFDMTMDSVQIPLANNPSSLPSAGTIHLSGGPLRQITIRFNENTPSTGVADVSLFGLFFFPVNLTTLNL